MQWIAVVFAGSLLASSSICSAGNEFRGPRPPASRSGDQHKTDLQSSGHELRRTRVAAPAPAVSTGAGSFRVAGALGMPGGFAGLATSHDRHDHDRTLTRALQYELARTGCYVGRADGHWSLQTHRALVRFMAAIAEPSAQARPDRRQLDLLRRSPKQTCRDRSAIVEAANRFGGGTERVFPHPDAVRLGHTAALSLDREQPSPRVLRMAAVGGGRAPNRDIDRDRWNEPAQERITSFQFVTGAIGRRDEPTDTRPTTSDRIPAPPVRDRAGPARAATELASVPTVPSRRSELAETTLGANNAIALPERNRYRSTPLPRAQTRSRKPKRIARSKPRPTVQASANVEPPAAAEKPAFSAMEFFSKTLGW